MKYLKLKNYKQKENIYYLWNTEYGKIYPISKELFERNLLNASLEYSYVVTKDDYLIGFIICKVWNEDFYINTYDENCWISLFYVNKSNRGNGIGTKLLNLVELNLKRLSKKNLYIGKDYLNYFPGLPVDLKNSANWFERRGFVRTYDTYDLIKSNHLKKDDKLKLRNLDIEYRICSIDDKEQLIAFIQRDWPGRWEKEAIDYFENGGTGKEYVVGIINHTICAFAKIGLPTTDILLTSYSLTWRKRFVALGGIGPLGVDASYRNKHIGYDIVAYAHNVLIDNNVSDIIIDWTGLLDFYRQFGFEVFKSYFYMAKTI